MGEAPCDILEVELALDRVEAALATELPAHLRAFAMAYAAGAPVPAAPDLAGRASTASVGRRALPHPTLADRGLALLRVVAPIVIERDAGVSAARARASTATPSWAAYAALSALRDTVAQARFGRTARALLHALYGAPEPAGAEPPGPVDPAWPTPDGVAFEIDATWAALVARYGIRGELVILRADVRPRAFVVEPGRAATVVVPAKIATPAHRFAVMHELGHAVGNLLVTGGLPRTVDEAVASLVARSLGDVMQARRTQLARALAAVERGELPGDAVAASPPWALWHDPFAQAAYIEAEAIADRLATASDLAAALVEERARIDRSTTL